ncbi:YceI family protein [Tenacibaculum aestuarii]|uniref:YceI family protein n=1 Tax=Tenacibaculum aestuarii TaxID=362781 RepID=UPI00389542AD
MKKIVYSLVICLTIAQIVSCKSEAKKETETTKEEVKVTKKAFVLQDATNTINWVAYKTTDKVPVKGQFQKVNITTGGEGDTAKEAINDAEFSIPVSSIFTQDSSRDFKIRKFFFGIMDKTELLSGKLVLENDSIGYADLTMNSVTKKLPFKYTLNGKEFSLSATMNISDWQAQNALDSLNTACNDLHKGADGVSKTWDDVALNITSVFK